MSHRQRPLHGLLKLATAGTLRHAQLEPGLSASSFPPPSPRSQQEGHHDESSRKYKKMSIHPNPKTYPNVDGFSDEDIDDQDMVEACKITGGPMSRGNFSNIKQWKRRILGI